MPLLVLKLYVVLLDIRFNLYDLLMNHQKGQIEKEKVKL